MVAPIAVEVIGEDRLLAFTFKDSLVCARERLTGVAKDIFALTAADIFD